MTSDAITYRGVVYPWQCDHMIHMNVMWYVSKFDEATWAFFAFAGITGSFMRENGRGMAALDQSISYQRELLAGDIVTIRSRPLELGAKTVRFRHEMLNDGTGEVAATSELLGIHLDTAARKGVALPDNARKAFEQMLKTPESA